MDHPYLVYDNENELLDFKDEVIAVVIPMYKVENYIQDVICGIPDWVSHIVVVNDASPDNSLSRATALKDPRILPVIHANNQGVGAAMLSGYQKAVEVGSTILIKMDGDNQMDPVYLADLMAPILEGRADFTKGNRFADAEALARMPFIRRIGNLTLSFMIKLASGYWNIFDPTNGYTAIDASIFSRLNKKHIHPRYFFESSLLIELNIAQAVIADVLIPARYQGEISSLSITSSLFKFPLLIMKGFLRRLWLKYFITDFSVASFYIIIGLLLLIFGSSWGLYKWSESIQTGIPATTGTVMIAVLPFILGFQLIIQSITFDLQNVPKNPTSRKARKRQNKINRSFS